MSKIEGVGYNPGPGLVFWIWPGSRESAGTTAFNPAAGDPFGTGASGTLNLAVFNARYGGRPVRADGTIGNFVVDAETVLGLLTRAMEVAAEKGLEPEFRGQAATHTMVPTLRESHDYAATHQDGGLSFINRVLGGGGSGPVPGQPRIDKLTSPGPGLVQVIFITGKANAFQIQAGSFSALVQDPQQGNTRTIVIKLPPEVGGEIEVTVQAFLGGVPGKLSKPKKVKVEPRAEDDEDGDDDDETRQHVQAIRQKLQSCEADLNAFEASGSDKRAIIQAIRQELKGCEDELKELETGLDSPGEGKDLGQAFQETTPSKKSGVVQRTKERRS